MDRSPRLSDPGPDDSSSEARLFTSVARHADDLASGIARGRVTPEVDAAALRTHLATYDFAAPVDIDQLTADVRRLLSSGIVQVTHPRYFGLFNPSVRPAAVVGDLLAALYNPQLAAWSHAPAANEIERHVLRYFTGRLGLPLDDTSAAFTTGGQEANHSAVAAALTRRFPDLPARGLRALSGQPVLYVSAEGHHSFVKIAQVNGLGRDAVRIVDVGTDLQMSIDALAAAIDGDRRAGLIPVLVNATAGTTTSGVVDPLPAVADLCEREGVWLHVDAAWGGAARLSRRLSGALDGIERADSVTWDAHKWLSVTIGAGMFFCRHPEAVGRVFETPIAYVSTGPAGTKDPYQTTLQWSRRFIGLKVFMALAELGAAGFEALIDRQTEMGERLRALLDRRGFIVLNHTRLPLVCFSHPALAGDAARTAAVAEQVSTSGEAWISSVRLPHHGTALRACITSYRTGPGDLEALVAAVERALQRGLPLRPGASRAPA